MEGQRVMALLLGRTLAGSVTGFEA